MYTSHTIRTHYSAQSRRIVFTANSANTYSHSHTIRTVAQVLLAQSHTIRMVAHYIYISAHYSHGCTLIAIRTVAHDSHTIRTVAHYKSALCHYARGSFSLHLLCLVAFGAGDRVVRGCLFFGGKIYSILSAVHALFAPLSHCHTKFAYYYYSHHAARNLVTLFARWGRASSQCSHSFTQYAHRSHLRSHF